MKIIMLETKSGSRTGILAEQFCAGQEYDLTGTAEERDLAAVFVRERWAREIVAEANGQGVEAEHADATHAETAQPEASGRRRRAAAK